MAKPTQQSINAVAGPILAEHWEQIGRRVLTPEMMEAVEYAITFLEKSDDKYDNSGPFWAEELRAAFGIEEA